MFTKAIVLTAALGFWLAGPLAAQSKGYKEVEVKNGATISGRVTFTGEIPRITFPITKNPEACCAEGEKEKPSPRLLVGKDGAVKNAVVFLTEVSEGKPFPQATPVLDQAKCVFTPHILFAQKGGKVSIRNSDPVLHNTHGFVRSNDLFNLAFPAQGQAVEVPMRRDGVVSLKCDAGHSWMSAYIFVTTHPYYAVTDEDGRFKLEKVPPGRQYTLRVWHEGWKLETTAEPYKYSPDVQLDIPVKPSDNESLDLAFVLGDGGKLAQKK